MDSKRTNAAVLQVFTIDESANPDDVLAAAGEIAQENGWIIDSTRASGITAHKTLSTGRVELGIAFMRSGDGQTMIVNLTASWSRRRGAMRIRAPNPRHRHHSSASMTSEICEVAEADRA